MAKIMTIAGNKIKPGEEKLVVLNIARLPSRTAIETPIHVSRSEKDGPTLLLMAGMHGDEINGMEIVRQIITKKYHRPDIGSTICIPVMNLYGFLNFSRELPDGKDINRSFPGNAKGSLASQMAYHIMRDILPQIDYGIDFHTGGAKRANYPQVRCLLDDAVNRELADAFRAPFMLHSPYRPKSLRQFAAKHGKHIMVFEGGEAQRLDDYTITHGIDGARRVMQHLGMTKSAPETKREPIVLNRSSWLRAHTAGIFHPSVLNGGFVKKGQRVGTITDPFGEYEFKLKSPASGYIIGLNHSPVVNHGDALLHVGLSDME